MNLLFDLDGTITDPFEGITNCIIHALTELGYPAPGADELGWCIGPPLIDSFAILLNSKDEQLAKRALTKYRERFGETGLFENLLYHGVQQVLDDLSRQNYRLFIATSKPRVYAEEIIRHFGLSSYFRKVYGSELDGTRSRKADLIAYILEQEDLPPDNTMMIGDRYHDIIGANANRLASIGVLWGYGSKEELHNSGATICVDSPVALLKAIQSF